MGKIFFECKYCEFKGEVRKDCYYCPKCKKETTIPQRLILRKFDNK